MKRFGTFVIFLRKYFWIFLIVLAFVLGLLTSSGPDKTLIQKFETEREVHRQQIEQKNARIIELDEEGRAIRAKAVQDSIQSANELKARETRIVGLQIKLKDAEKFKRASVPTLDSLRAALYGASPLHSTIRK